MIRGIVLALLLVSQITNAAPNISAEQMQMFESLPPSQQAALAKQYGIDISKLKGSNPTSISEQVTEVLPEKRGLMPFESTDETDFAYLRQMLEAQKNKQLKRFGVDTFATQPTSFSVPYNAPISQNYILGSGDSLTVHLYGKENETLELAVDRSGQVNFPGFGPITLSGLPFGEARSLINQTVKNKKIGVQSSVTLGEIRNIEISVVGDAFQPGKYMVSAMSTMTHALYASGGVSDTGSLRDIRLLRDGKLISRFDAYQLLLNGSSKNDAVLEDGDVLFIAPIQSLATVEGEVVRPGIYETRSSTTINNLIDMAGGFTGEADRDHITVERYGSNQLINTLSVNQTNGLARKHVKNGDALTIGQVQKNAADYVTLSGNVVRDGKRQWRSGLKLSEIFTSAERDVYDSADLKYSLILRRQLSGHYQALQFSLKDIFESPAEVPSNYTLQKQDHIYIFTRIDVEQYQQDYLQQKDREDIYSINGAEKQQQQEAASLNAMGSAAIVETSVNARSLSQVSPGETSGKTGEQAQTNGFIDYPLPREPSAYGLYFFEGEWLTKSLLEEREQQRIADATNMPLSEVTKTLNSTREKLLPAILATLKEQSGLGYSASIAEIFGEVKFPGFYPVAEGATIKSLIMAAGGLTENAYIKRSELVRTSEINQQAQTSLFNINIAQELDAEASKMTVIQAKDRINIFAIPNSNLQRMVSLQGEVMFPGTYVLNRGEKLSDLLVRAGGLTDFAHADGSVFTREALKVKEKEQLDSYVQRIRQEVAQKSLRAGGQTSISSPVEQLQLINELNKTDAMGRMVIDLPAVLSGETQKDFLLEDGDLLYVPQFRNTVTIMGEVQMPTSYLLDTDKDYDNYIDFAGGMKKQADEERIFVVRANGSVYRPNNSYWFNNKNQTLTPGDTIVVPVDSDYRDTLSTWTAATQILYQIGIAANAIKN